MKLVLEEALLITLRLKGGTVLARLRKEEFCHTEHYRDAMEFVTRLYNQVDEEVHTLVLLSNKCLQQLGNLGEAINFEEDCDQQYYGKGVQLVQDDSSLNMEEKVQILEKYLSNIIIQTERRKTELTKLVNLCEFYEMAQEWMLNCSECLSHLTTKARYSPSLIHCLQTYHQEGTKFSAENFIKMNKMVLALGSKKELKQRHILRLKCQQTKHHLAKFFSATLKDSSREYFHKVLKEPFMKISDEFDVEGVKLLSQAPNHSSSSNDDNIWVDKTKPVYNTWPLYHLFWTVGL